VVYSDRDNYTKLRESKYKFFVLEKLFERFDKIYEGFLIAEKKPLTFHRRGFNIKLCIEFHTIISSKKYKVLHLNIYMIAKQKKLMEYFTLVI